MKQLTHFIRQHIGFTILLSLILLILLVALLAPVIAPMDPTASNMANAFQPPSSEHLFGTDRLGRDVLSRVIWGTRTSVPWTLLLVGAVLVIGSFLGIAAGYFGGKIDAIIMRIADMMISFPGMVLAIAVAGILGASIRNAVIALIVISWTKYARLSRSLVLKIRHQDYVYAAITTGSKTSYILRRYMLPNALPTLIVTAVMDIGTMMLELAGLSFLGFGAQPPTAEWGAMLNEGREFMLAYPWLMLFPGLAICIVVIIFNLFGDSLRDILDSKAKNLYD